MPSIFAQSYYIVINCYLSTKIFLIDINECASNPCQNGGTCVDGINSYTCNCNPENTGDRCELNIDKCASRPCLNGATCRNSNTANQYTCFCVRGYAGINCHISNVICASK